jgi:ApeA N-terminal domain 1
LSQGRVIEIDNAVLRSVVDTRNYHTHYSEKLRAKAAKGADLVFLNETLALMCMCIIFEALGLREEQVEDALRRGWHLFPVTRMRTSLE